MKYNNTKRSKFNKKLEILIKEDELEEFRRITNGNMSAKVRELIRMYITAYRKKYNETKYDEI